MSVELIRAMPCWQGKIAAELLSGGLSNENWKVTDNVGSYVVRLGRDLPFHHVFRDRELAASRAAHAAGFAPAVHHAEPGVLVVGFVEGRTWTEADMRAEPARIAKLLRNFHQAMMAGIEGPPSIFWVFHTIRDYAATLKAKRSRFAPQLPALLTLAAGLEKVQVPLPIIFGHHDLLPGNFLDDGKKLWLIDFEYAAFGTAMFDLAGVAGNAGMDRDAAAELIATYFGSSAEPAMTKSFDAMKCAALLREAMWAMISEQFMNAPGADYDAHARDYLARLDQAVAQYQQTHGKISS
ncbi:MAG: phosphotransferase [Paracoccaceae bacterium]